MTMHFEDTLDIALARVQQGEDMTAVLQDYPAQAEDLAPLLRSAALLQTCNPVTFPTPEERLVDQQQFFDQMEQILPSAVSLTASLRLNKWMTQMLTWLSLNPNSIKKEQRNMGTLMLKAVLVLTIIFGSVGGTAVMAQESLPDSPLYPAKLMLEEAQLNLANNDIAQAEIHLDIANERLREMERLMIDGKMPEDALLERAENHVEAAFSLAEEMPNQAMAGVLTRAQEMMQTRTRAFAAIEETIPTDVVPAFQKVQNMLQNAGETVAAGLQDPQLFRHRHATNRPDTAPDQPEIMPPAVITATQTVTTPVRIDPPGPCAINEDCDPQGDGPYGPNYQGPQPEEPGTGVGPGEPSGNTSPGGPSDNPGGPNDNPGNPDSGCSDCDNGDGYQYGPQPEDSGNGAGMPGGSEEGVPIGGQSQNGSQYQAPENNSTPNELSPARPEGNDGNMNNK